MRLRPDLIEATVEQATCFWYEMYKWYFAAARGKADIFSMGDDFAGQLGMMIDPRDWRRFLELACRKLFGLAKDHGLHVWFHSCGAISPILPDLIDIGLDMWETVQAHLPGNEPERLNVQAAAVQNAIVKVQDPSKIALKADGTTDAISGASLHPTAVVLAVEALKPAR